MGSNDLARYDHVEHNLINGRVRDALPMVLYELAVILHGEKPLGDNLTVPASFLPRLN